MRGKKFLAPLFSENKRLYTYNLPLDKLRSVIEIVFDQSGIFQGHDIRARFTGLNSFQMGAPSPVPSPVLRSTLYGVLHEQDGSSLVETHIHAAISLRIWFWLSMVIGLGYLIQVLITGHFMWGPLALLILGPLSAVIIANVNNRVVEDRYERYIHRAVMLAGSNDDTTASVD